MQYNPCMRTRRFGVALGVLAGLSSSGPLGGFRPSSPDPTIWVDDDKHDFGTITNGGPVDHVFSVRHTGGKVMNIARVQTSCGCTAAVLGHQQLQPDEATQLKVTFDARGRHGSQSRTIWIHSDDPKNPQKQITISSNIVDATPAPAPHATATMAPVAGSSTITAPAAPSATIAVPAASTATGATGSAPRPAAAAATVPASSTAH